MAASSFFQSSGNGAESTKEAKHSPSPPWVEKYRPKSMDEIKHQDEVVAVLKKSLEGNDLPHLLFYGPPGTGKTSTILSIARQLFGPQLMKERVLELNASDERGIDVVRNKIKSFAQVSVGHIVAKGYPSPPFKIIILDEADSMTADAQSALRRTMEVHTRITRFCLICNYVSRIIEPLASRCAKFRFKPLPYSTMEEQLARICACESVDLSPDLIGEIVKRSGGDLRRAITYLQSCYNWKMGTELSVNDIIDITGAVPSAVIESLMKACKSGQYKRVQEEVQSIMCDGYAAANVIEQVCSEVVTGSVAGQTLRDKQCAEMALCLAQAEKCLVDRADEELQLLNAFVSIMKVMQQLY